MKASVIGLGKAGLPLAAVIADANIQVVGVDIDPKRVRDLNVVKNPIPEEPLLGDLIKKHKGKNFVATDEPLKAAKECSVHIIIVPLFIDDKKKADFSIIEKACSNVAKGLKKGDLVVLETTMPIGTTENRVRKILEGRSKLKAGEDFYLAYSPERIMTGYSISRYREFPKIVGGINDASTQKAFEFYKQFANPIRVSNARTAEMAKIAEGIYRDVNIALANELLKVAEHYDVNYWEVQKAANHAFCHLHEPGNVGGHCIPVYPWFVINDMHVPLIEESRDINDGMVSFYADKIPKGARKVGVIGLSYREGVKEKAYSRSIVMIDELKKRKYEVYGYDPLYSKEETEKEFKVSYFNDFKVMDALILMNKEIGLKDKLMPLKKRVIDIKNVLG